MFGVRIHFAAGTKRYAPVNAVVRGETWDGRLTSMDATTGGVDEWLPGSVRRASFSATVVDADGEILELLRSGAAQGRAAEVVWIGETQTTLRLKAAVAEWTRRPGEITFACESPVLVLLRANLSPVLGDIWPGVEGGSKLVPQVYGAGTRIPFAGGRSAAGNKTELLAGIGALDVDKVYHDGTEEPSANWTAETVTPTTGEDYTRVMMGGDQSRRPSDFSWDGGTPGSSWMVSDGIVAVLRENGVPQAEINASAFSALGTQLQTRGLQPPAPQEGGIVVTDGTLEDVLQLVLESWGIVVTLDAEGILTPVTPWASGSVVSLAASDILYAGTETRPPEVGTEWVSVSDFQAARGEGRSLRTKSAANRTQYGRDVPGEEVDAHYASGRSIGNIMEDRVEIQEWNQLRHLLVVEPERRFPLRQLVRVPAVWGLQSDTLAVDGIKMSQSGVDSRQRLSLSPVLGVNAAATELTGVTGTLTAALGDMIDEAISAFFTGGTAPIRYGLVKGPSWLRAEGGKLKGTAELTGTSTETHGLIFRAVDADGVAKTQAVNLAVSYVLQAPPAGGQVSVLQNTDTTATLTWDEIPRAATYELDIDGTAVTGLTQTTYELTGLTRPVNKVVKLRARNTIGAGAYGTAKTLHFLAAPSAPTLNFTQPPLLVNGHSTRIPGHFPSAAAWTAGLNQAQDFCVPVIGGVPSVALEIPLSTGTGITHYLVQETATEDDFTGAPRVRGDAPKYAASIGMPADRTLPRFSLSTNPNFVRRWFRRASVGSGGISPWSAARKFEAKYPVPSDENMRYYSENIGTAIQPGNSTPQPIRRITQDYPLANIPAGLTVRLVTWLGLYTYDSLHQRYDLYGWMNLREPLIAKVGSTYIRWQYVTFGDTVMLNGVGYTAAGRVLGFLEFAVGGDSCSGEVVGPSKLSPNPTYVAGAPPASF